MIEPGLVVVTEDIWVLFLVDDLAGAIFLLFDFRGVVFELSWKHDVFFFTYRTTGD